MYTWTKNDPSKSEIQGPLSGIDNVWYRRVDPMESSFSLSYLFSPGMADTIVSIQIALSESSTSKLTLYTVKEAMRELRFNHPPVAFHHAWRTGANLEGLPDTKDAVFAYKVPDSEEEVDAWLSTTVFDSSDTLKEYNGDIDAAIRCVTYEAGKRRDTAQPLFSVRFISSSSPTGLHGLVFHTSHAIFDGICAWQIIDLFVDQLAALLGQSNTTRRPLPWGEEVSRLPAPFVAASRVPWNTPKVSEDSIMAQRIRELSPFLKDAYGFPIPYANAEPSATGYITRTLSPDIAASLRTAARANGCTVFPLLYAIMSMATIRINPPSQSRLQREISNPTVTVPTNVRHLITDDPYDKSQWKARLSTGYSSYNARHLERFVHPPGENGRDEQLVRDIWTLSREIAAQLEENKKHSERTAVWSGEVLSAAMTAPSPSAEDPNAATALQCFSSIGVIDRYLSGTHTIPSGGDITVSSPRMCTTIYKVYGGYYCVFHPFTFKGEFIVSFSFAETAMGSEEEQRKAFDEGKRVAKGDASTVMVEYVEEYMNILRTVAKLS